MKLFFAVIKWDPFWKESKVDANSFAAYFLERSDRNTQKENIGKNEVLGPVCLRFHDLPFFHLLNQKSVDQRRQPRRLGKQHQAERRKSEG